ncbi:MAG: molybdopterin-synthase adenylyltransferase MoeB [Pseudomonadota bacterium]
MELTDAQLERYARHIVLREVGGVGQKKLLQAKVLVIGAGGLGSPLVLYLAGAGVGTIGIVDDDVVSLSNLQRQIAHTTDRINRSKTESAAAAAHALNPDVTFVRHDMRLDATNALALIEGYDIVADGSDNFGTRYLVNDACYFAKKPLVTGAIDRFDGQIATFRAYKPGANPCYRCVFSDQPDQSFDESCARDGILGAVAGVVGSLQAVEVLKEITGIGERLDQYLLIYDALAATTSRLKINRNAECRLCGERPSIRFEDRFAQPQSLPRALEPGAARKHAGS